MKTITKEIPIELSESVEATQLELNGIKQMLGFAYSTTEYNIPEERIAKLEKEFKDTNAKYEILKGQVEDVAVPAEFDKAVTSWSLDFKTHIVTVTTND